MSPAGHRHGDIAGSVFRILANHIRAHSLGKAYIAETGFLLARDPDTVRAPDAAFVCAERLLGIPSEGYFPGAPDLAVEVVSPSDRVRDIEDKVAAWLNAGSSAVWVVWPAQQAVCVHRPDQPPQCIGRDSVFHAGEPLPGFQFPVRELFE
jgi:Uma2 family endonuclease